MNTLDYCLRSLLQEINPYETSISWINNVSKKKPSIKLIDKNPES